jgi:hypothetical protein
MKPKGENAPSLLSYLMSRGLLIGYIAVSSLGGFDSVES